MRESEDKITSEAQFTVDVYHSCTSVTKENWFQETLWIPNFMIPKIS